MKKEMFEVLRLTREGRLEEAKALIERGLGMGHLSRATRAHVVEVPALAAASESDTEPRRPEPRGGTTTETEERVADEPPIPPRMPAESPRTRSSPTPLGGRANIFARLASHGPRLRQFPLELVAPAAGRWLAGSYTGQAGTRAYKLYLPSRYRGQSLPLIVMLHGCTQNPEDFAAGTRMNFLAEAQGFLVVFPEQAAGANVSRCWNWFQAAHQERGRGEPSLIEGITRQVIAEHRVDTGRVYIAGLSAGGAMAAILAAAYPELYAAVGVHSGLPPGSAHDLPSALQAMQHGGARPGSVAPASPIPLMLFQGDADSTVHPRNADAFIRHWVSAHGQSHLTTRQGQVPGGRAYSCTVYQELTGQTLVERWTVHGAGHAWSGGSSTGSFTDPAGPDASQELARFFQQHPPASAADSQPT